MKRNKQVIANLEQAVETMRDACEEARKAIARGDDHLAARRVLHAFAWGFANASGSIECAMARLVEDQAIADSVPVAGKLQGVIYPADGCFSQSDVERRTGE